MCGAAVDRKICKDVLCSEFLNGQPVTNTERVTNKGKRVTNNGDVFLACLGAARYP